MAYKDEYEVARLYTDGNFLKQVAKTFDGKDLTFEFHLAPPLLAKAAPQTGVPRKISFGPWMMTAYRVLARLKGLRGTAFDVFGYTHERRTERQLIKDYEALVAEIASSGREMRPPLAMRSHLRMRAVGRCTAPKGGTLPSPPASEAREGGPGANRNRRARRIAKSS
jgi:hypothetical protein